MADDAPNNDDIRRLRECFSYNSKTGILRWKVSLSTNVPAGSVAGSLNKLGYLTVRLDRKLLLVHRVVWAMRYGAWPKEIDHKNMNKADNRIVNLRSTSRSNNIANAPAKGRSGLPKGCYQLKGRRRWYSQIKVDGEVKRLGYFATAAEAAAAFKRAHRSLYGEFSRCDAR